MIEEYQTKSVHDPDSRYTLGEGYDDVGQDEPDHKYDKDSYRDLLGRLHDWVYQERVRQSENRTEMAIDANFADGLQFTDDEKSEIDENGMIPLVFNECKPAVEWIIGTEARTKIDHAVLPRQSKGKDDAITKTKLLKYLSDVNKSPFKRSDAFRHAVTVGVGWLETSISTDPEDEPIRHGCEHWRNVWWDSLGTELDLTDARYLFRSRYIDLDIALEMWPDRTDAIKSHAENNDRSPNYQEDDWLQSQVYYNQGSNYRSRVDDALAASHNRRMVVPVVEMWYRKPTRGQKVKGSRFNGLPFDDQNQEMAKLRDSGAISLCDAIYMEMRLAIFLDDGALLHESKSPYNHNRFPLYPIWCYRRDIDGMPYGVIRNARDAQFDLNKRRQKALWLLSTVRTVMEKGAVDDMDEFVEEVGRPNAVIEKNDEGL